MSYKLVITRDAEEDLVRHRKAGDKKALKRLARILDELREHPATGFGRPEQLKHEWTGYWSREITEKHRLIYQIRNETVTVLIVQAYGHYGDK